MYVAEVFGVAFAFVGRGSDSLFQFWKQNAAEIRFCSFLTSDTGLANVPHLFYGDH